jgi:thymidylate kinase
MGPDGSGKTSFMEEIEKNLKDKGIETQHVWIRSPKILSKPLMLYCRLTGLTTYKSINGIKYGKHEFSRSRMVSKLFPILQLVDFKLKWLSIRMRLNKNKVLIFDRFALDTLADLMVSTGNFNLIDGWIGSKFLEFNSEELKIILLSVDEKAIRLRKQDTLYDENLKLKIMAYQRISDKIQLKTIDNNRDFNLVKKEIFSYLNLL